MLRTEANWLAATLAHLDRDEISPLLNVGSSTEHFRSVRQPWIQGLVFRPLLERGAIVKHLDRKSAEGIDLVGDLLDPSMVQTLSPYGFRAILCSNVLEHVTNRSALCARLQELLPPGGHLIATVPRRFPYHPDPVDTQFRPSLGDLVALFPALQLVTGEEVDCGSFFDNLSHGGLELASRIGWLFLPFVRPGAWLTNAHRLMSIGSRHSVTCAIFRRPAT